MAAIDLAILAAFVLYAASAGVRNRRAASRNLAEYFLAGRSLSGWQAGLSMAATQFAADTPLLVTGLIATAGIFALWQLWIYAVAFLLMGFVLAGSWRRAGVLTDAELSELRYGRRAAAVLRGVKAVYFGTVLNCTVLAWVLFAAVRIAEPFLLWDQWLPPGLFGQVVDLAAWIGVPLTAGRPDDPAVWTTTASNLISLLALLAVVTAYSASGGLRGVVATDIVQIAVMLAGTAAFAAIVTAEAGGLAGMAERLRAQFAASGLGAEEMLAFTPDRARGAAPAVLGMLGLLWLIQLNADGSGYLAQRTMACRSDRDARTAAVVFTYTQVLVRSLLWLPLGLGLLVLFPPDPALAPALLQADREASYVRGMAELLPPGLLGLMLTGMLAALASTVDTHLNWGASYWTNDIYKRFVCQAWRGVDPDERALVRVARGANVAILAIALLVMTQLTSINQAWQTSLLMGSGMGVVLVLRWLWWRCERLGGDRGGARLPRRRTDPHDGAGRRRAGGAPAAHGRAGHLGCARGDAARAARGPGAAGGLPCAREATGLLGPDRRGRRRGAGRRCAAAGPRRRRHRRLRGLGLLPPGGRGHLAHRRAAPGLVPLAVALDRRPSRGGDRACPRVAPARGRGSRGVTHSRKSRFTFTTSPRLRRP